jgi:hypothetical protein
MQQILKSSFVMRNLSQLGKFLTRFLNSGFFTAWPLPKKVVGFSCRAKNQNNQRRTYGSSSQKKYGNITTTTGSAS